MPTYDYACDKCGASFELFQSMKDDPIKVCPKDKCAQKRWGKGRVSRQMGTGAGLIFKGSGFYITDYRSEGYKAAAQKDSDSAKPAATSSPSETKKPAESAATKPKAEPKSKSS